MASERGLFAIGVTIYVIAALIGVMLLILAPAQTKDLDLVYRQF